MNPLSFVFLFALLILVAAALETWRDYRELRRIALWQAAIERQREVEHREREAFGRYQAARDGAAAARMLREAGITGGEVEG